MQRYLHITEGKDKGKRHVLECGRLLIGRSDTAAIRLTDPNVSGNHLDVRVEPNAVWVQNQSKFGSFINEEKLTQEVSLNPGDVLKIGKTVLTYEESEKPLAVKPAPTEPAEEKDSAASSPDRTRANPSFLKQIEEEEKEKKGEGGETVVAGNLPTMMKSDPNWRPPKQKTSGGLLLGALVVLLLAGGAGYWYFKHLPGVESGGTIAYNDQLCFFRINYPVNWWKNTGLNNSDTTQIGFGHEGDALRARVDIHAEKQPPYATTGLTFGFAQYLDEFKKEFQDFSLDWTQRLTINGATVMGFRFTGSDYKGKGIYVLDDDNRIVIECYSPKEVYGQFQDTFSSILGSFALTTDSQKYIDFPMPTDETRAFAITHRTELVQQVENDIKQGGRCLDEQSLRPDNLFRSMQAYRSALQFIASAPDGLPATYPDAAAKGLKHASELYGAALVKQRFEIDRALREGDRQTAASQALKMMEMTPEKTESSYQEAYKIWKSLQRR